MAVQPRLENLSSDPSLRKTGSTRLTPSPIALLKRGEGKGEGKGEKHWKTAENYDFYQIFNFGDSCTHLIPDLGHIWHVSAGPWYTLQCQRDVP